MAEQEIIGRKEEIKILDQACRSKTAEFIAIYGRRRVGKTFLIRKYFSDKGLYFEIAGVKNLSLREQLENFVRAFSRTFLSDAPISAPKTWRDAFELLTKQMMAVSDQKKKLIIFLDEFPWLASKKSGLIPVLDYYWNIYWSKIPNIVLIVCGSAASWMLEHIVKAKGGLYHRLTKRILLEPFNLKEVSEYFQARSIKLNHKQILDLYMVLGGIPYYLKEVEKGKSTAQIIDNLCFRKNGLLYSEFQNIFRSLFDNAEDNLQIIRKIAKAGNAISREQLIEATGVTSGGTLNKRLEELEMSEFIRCFVPVGKKRRDRFYRIVDEYTLFYLKWIEPLTRSGVFTGKSGYWQKILKHPEKLTWAGYAFESVCFKHIDQVIQKLEFENMHYLAGSWRYLPPKKSKEPGAQIDLLFDRDDHAITICEIKYSDKPFVIEKTYAKSLIQKIEVLEKNYPSRKKPTKKQIFLTLITIFGLKENIYSEDLIHQQVILDDLFQ